MERLFGLIDLDGDGELTESEFIGVRIYSSPQQSCLYFQGLCPGQGAPGWPGQHLPGVSTQVRRSGQLREVEGPLQDGLLLAQQVRVRREEVQWWVKRSQFSEWLVSTSVGLQAQKLRSQNIIQCTDWVLALFLKTDHRWQHSYKCTYHIILPWYILSNLWLEHWLRNDYTVKFSVKNL